MIFLYFVKQSKENYNNYMDIIIPRRGIEPSVILSKSQKDNKMLVAVHINLDMLVVFLAPAGGD